MNVLDRKRFRYWLTHEATADEKLLPEEEQTKAHIQWLASHNGKCGVCGERLFLQKSEEKYRRKRTVSGMLFCCYICTGKHLSKLYQR